MSVGAVIAKIESKFGRRISPRAVSGLFYDGVLRGDICPIVCGRRVIPESYVPEIVKELQRRGKLPQTPGVFTC